MRDDLVAASEADAIAMESLQAGYRDGEVRFYANCGFDRCAAARDEAAVTIEDDHDRCESLYRAGRGVRPARIADDAANDQTIAVAFV
jgi:hypothetical protein